MFFVIWLKLAIRLLFHSIQMPEWMPEAVFFFFGFLGICLGGEKWKTVWSKFISKTTDWKLSVMRFSVMSGMLLCLFVVPVYTYRMHWSCFTYMQTNAHMHVHMHHTTSNTISLIWLKQLLTVIEWWRTCFWHFKLVCLTYRH